MKRKDILLYILAPILLLGVTITIVVAWYTNTHKIGNIDGETSDNVISYTLNDSVVNSKEYSVSNLTFFDIKNDNELKYFLDMAIVVKIDVENVTNNPLSFVMEYSYIIKYLPQSTSTSTTNNFQTTLVLPSTGINSLSTAYCNGFIIEDNKLNEITSKTFSNFLSTMKQKTADITLPAKETKTFYLYLFGVQEVSTSNNDFLSESFNFTLTLTSKVINTTPTATEVTKTTINSTENN